MSKRKAQQIIQVLEHAPVTLKGEFVWGSNYTFLVELQTEAGPILAVYKPTRGERPLWDFPEETLSKREVAAYIVSEALGWQLVPPTVYRQEGPLGAGSMQLFIEHDPEYHYFNLSAEDKQRLRPAALFDLLVNNADRKGSHILFDADRHIWLIDHGICFHALPKLRTVIWDFAGEPFPPELAADLLSLQRKLSTDPEIIQKLADLISTAELSALKSRLKRLLKQGHFPNIPRDQRSIPWPPV
jgi:uncharacterized repeat protein (TIGR03843 family)